MLRTPLNFKQWIDEHRDLFKPPVGNKMVWEDADFIIMVVGSNTRKDFHVNEGEEFFYQVEGDIVLKVQDDGKDRGYPDPRRARSSCCRRRCRIRRDGRRTRSAS